ncbi:EamA family transporter RarD [Nakamurella lactea]|uniref:EamA family transporter RarD n=1 Tax=Nakamurella lactea TaxID=459515 RepID=UPI00041F91C7|nr:EamA family transporter RarD [Nakamurella lactea]
MRRGVVAGVSAYLIWGLFPLYWPLLEPAGAVEILAHRMIWSLLAMALVLTALRQWRAIRAIPLRVWLLVALAAALIAVNWGVYIYAVNNGQVIGASLGYFMNPLVSVLIGVLALGERLRPVQWTAVGLGVAAAVVISISGGRIPYLSVVLALSFGCYGLVKKVVPLTPTVSLTAEGMVLAIPAAATVIALQASGDGTLTDNGIGHVVLLLLTGVVTVIPLLAFGRAAQALPLSVLGLLQYLTPVVQFLLGVLWAHESMPPARWAGFGLIWCALVLLSADALRRARRSRVAYS